MKKIKIGLLSILFSITMAVNSASAAGLVMAGVNYYAPNIAENSLVTIDSVTGLAAGVGARFGDKSMQFEIDLLYLQQNYKLTILTIETEVNANYLQIPFLLRFGSDMVSFGVGAFYALGIDGEFTLGGTTFEFANQDDDYGLLVALGLNLGSSVFLEARYNFGIADTDSGTNEITTSAVQAMLGVMF